MMMKISIDEMEIGHEYWLDDQEDISGKLVNVDDPICFEVTECDPKNEYGKSVGDMICFPINDYLYKPKN